jgi:predicted dehydrogenase
MRFAVLGLDHWYTAFGVCEILAASKDNTLATICTENDDHAAWATETYPAVNLMRDPQQLFADPDIDCVLICAPTALAEAYAIDALASGKHVLGVKPTSNTIDGLEKIIKTAKANGAFYGSFEGIQRFHPKTLALKNILSAGTIGRVLSVHQVGNGGLPAPWEGRTSGEPSWWIDPEMIHTGAWMDHAIYAIDLLRFSLNAEVDAVTGHIGNRLHADLPLGDYGMALLRLSAPSGAVSVVMEDTWSANQGGGAHWMRIVGTDGWLRSEGDDWVVCKVGEETVIKTDESVFFRLDDFAAALDGAIAMPFTPEDALANVGACHKFYAAALRD